MNKIFIVSIGILILLTAFIQPRTNGEEILDTQQSRYVELTVIQGPIDKEGMELIFRFRVRPPYHINSGSPLIKGLIPTTISLDSTSARIAATRYPPDEILDISGFRTTVYFNGPHDLRVTLKREGEGGSANYIFHYQACQDDECYEPEEITGILTLAFQTNSWSSGIFSPDLFWTLLFAFLGGILLNITPCVLPILSLKLLSLSTMRDTEQFAKKKFAGFHILGAMTFFLLIASGVVILKASGEQLGWGFQFQNPHYIFFITLVLTAITLNLLGTYEIPFSYQRDYPEKKRGENLKNFGTGFLSVILATPCTVPFLGIAAAYSFSQGAATIFLLHIFTALGFVIPYGLIFAGVDISRIVPRLKPAERYIKKIFGFMVGLTLIWLIDIYWSLTGGGMALLGTLWLTSLVLWGYGEVQRYLTRKWNWGFWIAALLIGGFLVTWTPTAIRVTSNPTSDQPQQSPIYWENDSAISWERFSRKRLEEHLASSRLVYVHFTADWCLNCKVNEKLVLEDTEVIDLFSQYQVVMMKADWTKSDEEIFDEIQSLGRVGIPLDVLYREDKKTVFSSILTVGEIRSALQGITR